MSASIVFVLPGPAHHPIGGYRIVVEYANRLAARGERVAVAYRQARFRELPVRVAKEVRARVHGGRQSRTWFHLDPRVEELTLGRDARNTLGRWDVAVATAWQTADLVAQSSADRRMYLIQHYEAWGGERQDVDATWRLPLHKIVISRWLRDRATALGEQQRTSYVPNGMDLDFFKAATPFEERPPFHVGMMVHPFEWKGTDFGLRALEIARQHIPELQATVFGSYDHRLLPDWITFAGALGGTDVPGFYDGVRVFLHPSLEEGWPLPPAEAMACGCMLIAADNPGVLDYAGEPGAAVVVPRKDPAAMAAALVSALNNPSNARRVAEAGQSTVSQYTWERAVEGFLQAIAEAKRTS